MSRSCVKRAAQTLTRVVTTDSLFLSYRTAYITYPASRETLRNTPACIVVDAGCGTPTATTVYVTYPGSTATSRIPVTITSHYYATYVTTLTTTSCTTVSTRPPSSSRPRSTSIYKPPPPPPTTTVISTVVPPPTPSTSNLLSTASPSATTRSSSDTPTSSSRSQVTVSRLDATEPTDSFSSPTVEALPSATTTNSSRNVAFAVGFGIGGVGAAVLLGLVFFYFILPKVVSLFGLKAAKSVALHRVIQEPDFDDDFDQHNHTENAQGNIQMRDIQTTSRVPTHNAYQLRHNHQGYAVDGLSRIRPTVMMPQVAGGYPSGSKWGTNARATGYPGSVPAAGHNLSYTTSPNSSLLSATPAVRNGLRRHQSYTGSRSPGSARRTMMRSMSLFPGQYTGCAESMG